mgnify:CR=1 FL=1
MPLEDLPPPPRSGQAVRGNKRKSAGGAAAAAQQAAGNEEGQEQQHEEGEDHVPKATEADRPTKRRATDDNAPAAVGGAAGDATAVSLCRRCEGTTGRRTHDGQAPPGPR